MPAFRTLCLVALLALAAASARAATDFAALVDALPQGSFSDRAELAGRIAASGHPRAGVVLTALVEGELFQLKASRQMVIAKRDGTRYTTFDASTGEALDTVKKSALGKIKSNNRLRKEVRGHIAGLELGDADPARRLAAAEALLGNPDPASTAILRGALETESDGRIRDVVALGLALIDLESDDTAARLAAIETLSGSVRPEIIGALHDVARDTSDTAMQTAAVNALDTVETRLALYRGAENLFFGLSLGSVLLLAAIGLAVTFGVMGVINMAHGEMVMLGAYTTFVVQSLMPAHIEYSLLVAVPAAFTVTAAIGILIERGVIRFLYGRPLETLLATFGISLILQQTVRSVFSPLNRSVATPEWMSGALEFNPALAITYNRLYIIVFALVVVAALALVLRRTRFGLEVRAVTQNRPMARAMGIRTARVDALTFGLGSGIAGMAGVALSQLTNVGPNMGQAYIVDSFMVVVFGGVGNLMGTVVGAMTLGIANKFLEPVSGAVLAKVLVLVFIILFIQRRPQGLFALRGRVTD